MRKISCLLVVLISFLSCEKVEPTQFTKEALNATFLTLNGNSIAFKNILETHKDKQILIDVWASWCGDCIKSIPKVKALQKEYPDVTFVFLSVDKQTESWKNAIGNYQIQGEHYYMGSGNDSPFAEFIELSWIPRFMIVSESGDIALFEALDAENEKIKQILN